MGGGLGCFDCSLGFSPYGFFRCLRIKNRDKLRPRWVKSKNCDLTPAVLLIECEPVSGNITDMSPGDQGRNPDFATTQWSLVLAAMDTAPARASAALEHLCARYWFPIYAFIRRQGHEVHQAEDLTQSFFQFVLERRVFHQADREKGRFRNFILASLANFLNNQRDHAAAVKRGGHQVFVSWDGAGAEEFLAREPRSFGTPGRSFERGWALAIVRQVLDRLRAEHAARGRLAVYEALQPHLTGEPAADDYNRLAAALDMETGALKVAVHRLRRRFGELLRKEVAYTVTRPEDVEEEIRHLLAMLAE